MRSSAWRFDIMTNEGLQAARTGNWFQEHNLCIARLDKLSRNEDVQAKVASVDWDLDHRGRIAQNVGVLLRLGNQIHEAFQARPGVVALHAAVFAADGHTAQRQGRGLPHLSVAAGRRPFRGQAAGRRACGGCIRRDAAHGEGAVGDDGGQATVSGAICLHGGLHAGSRKKRTFTVMSQNTCAKASTTRTS